MAKNRKGKNRFSNSLTRSGKSYTTPYPCSVDVDAAAGVGVPAADDFVSIPVAKRASHDFESGLPTSIAAICDKSTSSTSLGIPTVPFYGHAPGFARFSAGAALPSCPGNFADTLIGPVIQSAILGNDVDFEKSDNVNDVATSGIVIGVLGDVPISRNVNYGAVNNLAVPAESIHIHQRIGETAMLKLYIQR